MFGWMNELPTAACAAILCFALAWRSPLLGAALAVGAAASLWAHPETSAASGAVVLATAALSLVLFAPRARASAGWLALTGVEAVRARWRRPSMRLAGAARVAVRSAPRK